MSWFVAHEPLLHIYIKKVCLGVSLLVKAYGPVLLSMLLGGGGGDSTGTSTSSQGSCGGIGGEEGGIASLFAGWTGWTLIPVFINAAGGIIVGLVTKYAGGVSKGFALIAGILLTAFIQAVVQVTFHIIMEIRAWLAIQSLTHSSHQFTSQARPPPFLHWIAAILVATSTYMHQAYRSKPPKAAIEGTPHRKKSHYHAATGATPAASLSNTMTMAKTTIKDKDL